MSVHRLHAPVLPGRTAEVLAVERLLERARAGQSGALVVRGEAGIGKSALIRHVQAAAPDMLVICEGAAETERTLPYAGLHLVLKGVLGGIDELPEPQALALRGALGLGSAGQAAGDRFLVGLAVLTLLAELAADRPVLCLVDDAHWLDRASADVLLFAARRLAAEGVLMIFAARDDHAPAFAAGGLDELVLQRLDPTAAAAVLAEHAPDLPRHVVDWIRREAQGNPLALIELANSHLAGRSSNVPIGPLDTPRLGATSSGSRVEREFMARIAELPAAARTAVLVGAADGTCDMGLVVGAAALLGSTLADFETAQRAELLMFVEGCYGFQHPLIRAAVYRSATIKERQDAHLALAAVLGASDDVDRQTWHRAAAAVEPDENVAVALDRSAERARERGSPEAAASASEQAAGLSTDAAGKGRRYAEAAEAASDAGQREWAASLAGFAALYLRDPVQLAKLARITAALAVDEKEPERAARPLLDAARAVAEHDAEMASDLLMRVVEAGWAARARGIVDQAVAAVDELRLPGAEHVRALATVAAGQLGDETALQGSFAALRTLTASGDPHDLRVMVMIANCYLLLGDHESAHAIATQVAQCGRNAGKLHVLPGALAVLAATWWHRGQRCDAVTDVTEGLRLARDTGQQQSVGALTRAHAHLAAVAGEEAEFDATSDPAQRGLLALGLGRFDEAADRLAELDGDVLVLPDLVEAAARAGREELARTVAERFARWAEHVGQPWARAVARRSAALADCDHAEPHFVAAAALHRSDGARPFERARTDLLHGEWLRRTRRRSAARAPLRAALETFEQLGAAPWAARARSELRATGETRSAGPSGGPADLTPQELLVVRLAAAGLTNRDIGAQLFLSPRTVGYHLHKAFPKLGVASRAQLATLDLSA
ncbi:ATP-binding protein [Pseudonocardia sp. TRM90224]|uniref:ATP-binding protein n=1 Tax=Pseudonocardia sp. TRM90224 TaxID=2812678 RepID=UPI001E41B904|nr:LuxR family transcriptional regulator [Pseudonocardia sp. TRM90224]